MKNARDIALMILESIYFDLDRLMDQYIQHSYYTITGYADTDLIIKNKLIRESSNINKIAYYMVLGGEY